MKLERTVRLGILDLKAYKILGDSRPALLSYGCSISDQMHCRCTASDSGLCALTSYLSRWDLQVEPAPTLLLASGQLFVASIIILNSWPTRMHSRLGAQPDNLPCVPETSSGPGVVRQICNWQSPGEQNLVDKPLSCNKSHMHLHCLSALCHSITQFAFLVSAHTTQILRFYPRHSTCHRDLFCVHDSAQAFARMQQIKRLVDVLELQRVRHILIHSEFSCHISVH